MNEMSKYFKPSIVALEPYSSARDEYVGQTGIMLDANENSFDFDFNRYPDPYQKELKKAIGEWREVDPDTIFLGNGSDEIIDLLIRSTCSSGKDRILSLDPSYGMYRVSSSINEIPLDLVQLNKDFSVDSDRLFEKLTDAHKLVFICSPNNPNGGIVDPGIIEKVLQNCNGLVVIDEAYIDFSGTESWIGKLSKYKNLIVLQTFSKSLAAAGIRLGIAFMDAELITYLNKLKPPYNISVPNQTAALRRLKSMDKVSSSILNIVNQKNELSEFLHELAMVDHVFPSFANFLLVRFKEGRMVFEQLKARNIIVRDRSTQVNCEGCLRITIGTEEENRILINALREINSQMRAAL